MDEAEFDDWVAPHLGVLRALTVREVGPNDADDVVQDVLIRAWRRRQTYRAERGTARAWLVGVLFDQLRRRRVRARPFARLSGTEDGAVAVESAVGSRLDVENAVMALPRRQREVITLFYLADLSVEEVAHLLGLSPGSVKSYLSDARESLRAAMESSL